MLITTLAVISMSSFQPDLSSCRAISEASERLACYDAIADSQAQQKAASTFAAPKSEAELQQEFERKAEASARGEKAALTAAITEIELGRDDRLKVTLENGQVWYQLSSDRIYRINSKKPPQSVTITEAALGSYRLKFDDSRQTIRVRRAQ